MDLNCGIEYSVCTPEKYNVPGGQIRMRGTGFRELSNLRRFSNPHN